MHTNRVQEFQVLYTFSSTYFSFLFSMVLIGISLMIGDGAHLFMYLLGIWISSLEKCLFKSFAPFLVELFGLLNYRSLFQTLTPYHLYGLQMLSLIP